LIFGVVRAITRHHVHRCLSIPPKYAVSGVAGYLKGKSAIMIVRQFDGRERNFAGESFWARGFFASTVGLDEATVIACVRDYIRVRSVRLSPE
jgi:putative transposase